MKKITAILVFFLMSYPVYGRDGRPGVRTTSALRAAASTSENSSDTEGDDADNESDDQEMDSDNETDEMDTNEMETDDTDTEEMETDESDSEQEMDTDDGDSNGTSMHDDSDDESDDTDDDANPVQSAIRASLKAATLKQSQSSLGRLAAALDAGLSPRQTINELLDSADSGSIALATAGSNTGFVGSSTVAAGSAMPTSGALLVSNSAALMSSPLTASAVPEPAAWLLAATAILAPMWKRRRSNRVPSVSPCASYLYAAAGRDLFGAVRRSLSAAIAIRTTGALAGSGTICAALN